MVGAALMKAIRAVVKAAVAGAGERLTATAPLATLLGWLMMVTPLSDSGMTSPSRVTSDAVEDATGVSVMMISGRSSSSSSSSSKWMMGVAADA